MTMYLLTLLVLETLNPFPLKKEPIHVISIYGRNKYAYVRGRILKLSLVYISTGCGNFNFD